MVEAQIGGGAGGDIFRALDQQTGEQVALKVLRKNVGHRQISRFMREIAVLADLRHPNIVTYVSHGTRPDGRMFLAMEWLEGEDLAKRQRKAPLGISDSVEVVRRSAQALAAVHARGIVHRDLKLSNMFLVQGRGTAVKLIDFGVVTSVHEGGPGSSSLINPEDDFDTEQGTIIGTPHYMAPEQARGELVDVRADVYSLGSVLYRLLTGRNVFETEHVIALLGRLVLEDPPRPGQLRFDIPPKLDAVVHRAISRNPGQRYANAAELARALARVGPLTNEPPQVETSASQVRPKQAETTGSSIKRGEGLGQRMRRVVACMVYASGGARATGEIHERLLRLAGEDARIEQLAGGETVAVLGVERSHGDEAMRAARVALQLLRDRPEARAVVSVGHAAKARSDLAGEALDRAAEQLQHAKPGTVRLDMHAAAALERSFDIRREADGAELIQEALRNLAPRKLLGRPTPTMERERQISELQERYAATLADNIPRAVLVLGPPGAGKSRVRCEITQRFELAPVPPEIWECRGTGSTGSSALGKALRAQMGVQDGAESNEQMARVKRFARSRLPRSLRFLEGFLGELAGIPLPTERDEVLRAARADQALMQARLRMTLEALFRTQAAKIPQLILLEDAHLTDELTLDLIGWLMSRPNMRLTTIAFAGPELVELLPKSWQEAQVDEVALPPLSAAAAHEIIAAALPSASEAERSELADRAEGNPLVLEELVRCFSEGNKELPLTVQAMVQLRLDRLAPSVRETVRAAAVFGQTFWSGGIAALLGRRVDDDLEQAEREEVILSHQTSQVAGQREWVFRQSVVREAAHASLLDDDRTALHLAAGEWLEGVGSQDLGLVAGHFEIGNHLERAATLYAHATQRAHGNLGAMETAVKFAHHGLRCGATGGERAQLLLTLADAHSRTGRLLEGAECAEAAAELVPPASDMWTDAQRHLATCLVLSGRASDGDARLASALSGPFASKLTPSQRASLLAARVRALIDLGRTGQAMGVAEAAVEAARSAGPRGQAATLRALSARAAVLATACRPAEASEAWAEYVQAAERAGDMHLASRGRINQATALLLLGLPEEAGQLLEEAQPTVRTFHLRILEAACLHRLGMVRARGGQADEGIAMQREAAKIAEECGSLPLVIDCKIYEASMLVWRGAPGDLRIALERATEICESSQQRPSHQVLALFTMAQVQLARLRLNDALEAAREAHRRLDDGPVQEWDEPIRLCFIRALLASRHEAEADEALRTAFEVLRQRSARIADPRLRAAFVSNNDAACRLLAMAKNRLGLSLS